MPLDPNTQWLLDLSILRKTFTNVLNNPPFPHTNDQLLVDEHKMYQLFGRNETVHSVAD